MSRQPRRGPTVQRLRDSDTSDFPSFTSTTQGRDRQSLITLSHLHHPKPSPTHPTSPRVIIRINNPSTDHQPAINPAISHITPRDPKQTGKVRHHAFRPTKEQINRPPPPMSLNDKFSQERSIFSSHALLDHTTISGISTGQSPGQDSHQHPSHRQPKNIRAQNHTLENQGNHHPQLHHPHLHHPPSDLGHS